MATSSADTKLKTIDALKAIVDDVPGWMKMLQGLTVDIQRRHSDAASRLGKHLANKTRLWGQTPYQVDYSAYDQGFLNELFRFVSDIRYQIRETEMVQSGHWSMIVSSRRKKGRHQDQEEKRANNQSHDNDQSRDKGKGREADVQHRPRHERLYLSNAGTHSHLKQLPRRRWRHRYLPFPQRLVEEKDAGFVLDVSLEYVQTALEIGAETMLRSGDCRIQLFHVRKELALIMKLAEKELARL